MAQDSRAAILRLLDQLEPQVARAYEEAVQDIRSTAQATALEKIIRDYADHRSLSRLDADLEAYSYFVERGFFAPLDRTIDNAFLEGALYQTGLVPKRAAPGAPKLVVRFNGRHERAERWTRERSADLVTEVAGEDHKLMIRETIVEGVEENRGYRKIGQDLIGRPQGNKRTGGVIGLHSRQAAAVRAARRELESGDYSAYLSRSEVTRDRRFDRTIKKAQREGTPLTADQIDKITGRYADGLLQYRSRLIARTEANAAMSAGRHEAIQQMIDSGKITADLVSKIWDATPGKWTRDHHLALSGVEVAWGQPFISPKTGFPLDRPHDPEAPAVDTANCRCTERIRTDFAGMIRR